MNEPRNCRPVPPFLLSGINCAATSTTDINQALITVGNRRNRARFMARRCDVRDYVNVREAFFLITIAGRSSGRCHQFCGSQLYAKIAAYSETLRDFFASAH